MAALVTLALLGALVYTWIRAHRRLRRNGYGAGAISGVFILLLFVCLWLAGLIQGSMAAAFSLGLWSVAAFALARTLPARKGAVKDGRVVQVGERRAGKRRAFGATAWGWTFTVVGGAATIFFLWQLVTPTLVPRDQGWKALIAALGVWITFSGHYFGIARRSHAAPEVLPSAVPSVLYLRAFDEEQRPFVFGPRSALKKFTTQFAAHAPGQSRRGDPTLRLTLEDYLEEAITALIGPFVALGNPYDRAAPDGALREYAPDGQWQSRFLELARTARCIVVSIGGSANLAWELQTIKALGLGQKLCLFTSPIVPGTDRKLLNRLRGTAGKRDEAIAADWALSRDVLGQAGFHLAENPGPGAVVTFDEQGQGTLLTTDAQWPADFIAPAADWFKDGKKTGRCMAVACGTCGARTHVAPSSVAEAGQCYACREQQQHAAKPLWERHPSVFYAWFFASLLLSALIAQGAGVTTSWVVIPLWFTILVLPVVVPPVVKAVAGRKSSTAL